MPTRVKICCISSSDEAALAVEAGASALGLVSEMPSGPGVIAEDEIAEIAAAVPPGIATFLLTPARDADTIIGQQQRTGVNTVQLVDEVPPATYRALRQALPGIKLVQVIHVRGPGALEEVKAVMDAVDAILLDSGNPDLAVKELGGTGRVHDWTVSRQIVQEASVPVYLAGGLNSANVGEAIRTVRPFGLDLCSGVRTDDRLDGAKLSGFFSAVARPA